MLSFEHFDFKIVPIPDIIKILKLPQPYLNFNNKVTCLNFGPYDNGYIIVGTSSGHIIVLNPITLKRVFSDHLFPTSEVKSITFEPTQLVMVGSSRGTVKALNIVKQQMAYVYLDLGQKEYATVTLNHQK